MIASVPPTDHGWLGAISKNAKAQAAKYDDLKFELLQAADADSQAQQIEQAIEKTRVIEAGKLLPPVQTATLRRALLDLAQQIALRLDRALTRWESLGGLARPTHIALLGGTGVGPVAV